MAPTPDDARVVRTRRDVLHTALTLLVDEGRDAVTHHRVAEAAGYSRATVYKHWPTRMHLLRDAFAQLEDGPHHVPTGDLRSDLVAEVTQFRTDMQQDRLDRALTVLADLAVSNAELAEVRDRLVADGERVLRQVLASRPDDPEREAALLMLCGAVLYSALLHGRLPGDDVIGASVDIVLRGLSAGPLSAVGGGTA
jgi:AcrR family transcriptional regulator